ncbi:histidine kinase dimerization/phosphoacceptor domain -containing protein [Lutibacter sp.]|uniref:tetratricopeptide repeat-containing sensor histidine kinase n=1 Tax=Lutibacter sp. TaxID=1925666 RepID=UPI0025BEEF98|nr:histidine kinase dimerization/phosphoacceptor domain -containing protein [Lutibacter sp.]MCF6169148.1 sensor histidine kinase [Lutibacter sp.]
MKKYFYSILFLFSIYSYAQKSANYTKKIDSIYQNLVGTELNENKNKKTLGIIGQLNYPENSKKIINRILKFSLNTNSSKQITDAYYALSNYFFFNSKLDSSLTMLEKTELYLDKNSMPLLKASVKMTKGGVFQRKGNIIKANHNYLMSLEILDKMDTLTLSEKDKIKQKGKKLILFNSIAIFNKNTENYDKATLYYNKAYKMALELGNKRLAGILLSNQGDLLIKIKQYNKALSILEKSKKIKDEINAPPKSKGVTNLNIALVYSALNNYNESITIFNSIIPLFRNQNSTANLMYSLVGRGQLYNQNKEYKKAIADCEESYNLAIKSDELEYQSSSAKCLADAYKSIHNYEKAYYYQTQYLKFKDAIFNSNNVKKITQMQMQYDFDRKNELQEIETKNKARENKIIILSLALGLLSLLFFSGMLYKQYTIRKKNNQILASKNIQIKKALDDNEVLLKETHHRVKNSLQMISSLLYLQSENIEDKNAAASVKDGQIRVKSMALIHQKLYQKDNLTGVEVSDYINDLAESIFQSHNININTINLHIDVDKMILDIDTITPIGIIINELIVNALKHAFTTKKSGALISISLHKKNNILLLKVADNGAGFNAEKKKEKSFGLKLINSLSRKLKADLTITNNNGTLVVLKIKRFIIK